MFVVHSTPRRLNARAQRAFREADAWEATASELSEVSGASLSGERGSNRADRPGVRRALSLGGLLLATAIGANSVSPGSAQAENSGSLDVVRLAVFVDRTPSVEPTEEWRAVGFLRAALADIVAELPACGSIDIYRWLGDVESARVPESIPLSAAPALPASNALDAIFKVRREALERQGRARLASERAPDLKAASDCLARSISGSPRARGLSCVGEMLLQAQAPRTISVVVSDGAQERCPNLEPLVSGDRAHVVILLVTRRGDGAAAAQRLRQRRALYLKLGYRCFDSSDLATSDLRSLLGLIPLATAARR
jgi:hypothetical protein